MNVVLLFTKQYPFGRLETYLNHEIHILSRHFDKVIIVPVDAYHYDQLNPLIATLGNVEVLRVNEYPMSSSAWKKIVSNLVALKIFIREVFKGQEGMSHIKNLRYCLTYLKVCYYQAENVFHYLEKEKLTDKNIVLYNYWLYKTTIAATFLTKKFNRKIQNISRAHSSDLYHKFWNDYIKFDVPPFMPYENFKVTSSDHVYTISDHGRNHFMKVFPSIANRFSVARLGVNEQEQLTPFGVEEKFRIVTCSAIFFNKRLHRIPGILSHLKDLPVEWVHLGWGDDKEVAHVKSEIEKHGVTSACILAGRVHHGFVLDYYRDNQVNLILNLSQAEGIPVSLMEAISFGIPGIATRVVGNPEIIDETCGFTIPAEFEAKEVADRIRQICTDKALQQKLRDGALAMFHNRYFSEKNYKAFSEMLVKRAENSNYAE